MFDFDNDLRDVMKRSGVKHEKITFIFDESNVLGPAFLEKMNALLASGEIPGLFEGEEYMALMSQCREAQMKDNKIMVTTTMFIDYELSPSLPCLIYPFLLRTLMSKSTGTSLRTYSATCTLCSR